jgi:uncharacterized protein (TIGR03067 family)
MYWRTATTMRTELTGEREPESAGRLASLGNVNLRPRYPRRSATRKEYRFMKPHWAYLAFVFAAFGDLNVGGSREAGEIDARLLRGKWRVLSAEQNGSALTDFPAFAHHRLARMYVVFDEDQIRVLFEGSRSVQAAKFTVDPKQAPKQIDFTKETLDREWPDDLSLKLFRRYKWTNGKTVPVEGTAKGIYKLDGDTLTLCWRTTEGYEVGSKDLKVRPSVFQSVLYYHQFLFVLERVKTEE